MWEAEQVSEIWITLRTPNRRALTVLVDAPLVVGRDCDGLILADQRVSRRHTGFEPSGDKIQVTDLGSSNGTSVNGTLITGPTLAGPGDLISIGNTVISVQARQEGEGPISGLTTELTPPTNNAMKTSIELVAEAVEQDDPRSMIGAEVVGAEDEPGTLTVLFSDIESSTELAVAMGDAKWFDLLGQHHELVATHVDAHQGRIVKNQGDGYMLCFRSARQALLTAIGIQRDLSRLSTSLLTSNSDSGSETDNDNESTGTGNELRVRIGVHTGEVMMQDDGDLFGKHVIVAARIGALAAGGQILVSNLVKQIAEPRGDISFGPATETALKGIEGVSVIHEVSWMSYVAD